MAAKYKRSTPPSERIYRSSPSLVQQKFPSLNARRRSVKTASAPTKGVQMVDNTLTQMLFPVTRQRRDDEIIADSEAEDDIEEERPVKRRKVVIDLSRDTKKNIAISTKDDRLKPESASSDGRRRGGRRIQEVVSTLIETKSDDDYEERQLPKRRKVNGKGTLATLVRDNTLTQMEFFDNHDSDLQSGIHLEDLTEELKADPSSSQTTRTRTHARASMAISSPTLQKQSDAITNSAKASVLDLGDDTARKYGDDSNELIDDVTTSLTEADSNDNRQRLPLPLPLPRTPQKTRVLVVPSSQTPYATPIGLATPLKRTVISPSTPTPIRVRPAHEHNRMLCVEAGACELKQSSPKARGHNTDITRARSRSNSLDREHAVTAARICTSVSPTNQSVEILSSAAEDDHKLLHSFERELITQPDLDKARNVHAAAEAQQSVIESEQHLMVPTKMQTDLTQVNNAIKEIYTSLDTQTQMSQTTKKRIQDFNLAMQHAACNNIAPNIVQRQRPVASDSTATIGLETQLELMNDDLDLIQFASNITTHQGPEESEVAVADLIHFDHHNLNDFSSSAPSRIELSVMVGATAEPPSPPAWKHRSFVSEPAPENENERFMYNSTAELLAQQLHSTDVEELQRVAFSQASTVPCTPMKTQASLPDLPLTSDGHHEKFVSLVTSSPDTLEQTMSSSPIQARFEVRDSQCELGSSPAIQDLGMQEINEMESLPYGSRNAYDRHVGISQLLPSSILNSDIPMPPRWQESAEVDI